MAGMNQDTDDEITQINVTPFVDVVLVLLIVFMATTSYIAQKSIDVTLPDAVTGETNESSKALTITIDKEANIFINKKKIAFEDLPSEIQSAREKGLPAQVFINADEKTPHGIVVKLIDEVRKNGIREFSILVD